MAQKFLTDIELTQGLKDSSGDLGSSGQVLSSTGTGLNWIDSTANSSVIYQDGFTGNGTTTAFTLANSIDNENKTQVYLDGVYQHKDTYSLSGTTLTFSTAPPNSSDIEVISFASITADGDILTDSEFSSAGLMKTDGSGTYSIVTDNSSNWNTAYTYSQVGHLPLAGGTITGNLIVSSYIQSNNNFLSKGTLKFRNNADSSWLNGFRRVSGADTLELINISNINTNGGGAITISTSSTFASDVTISGNLTVNGTTTTLNTQTVEVEDNILQLNTTQGSPDTATATTSGISIYRGDGVTQASFIFDDGDDTWDLTNNLVVAGSIKIDKGSNFTSYEVHRDNIKYGEFGGGSNQLTLQAANNKNIRIVDDSGNGLTIADGGNAIFSEDISIPVAKKLYFGGGNHTYIGEDIDDRLRFFTGGTEFMRFTEDTSDTINFYTDVTFANKILNTYSGTGFHELQNATSNGTVLRLSSTGDSRTLTLQTDHIFSNGNLFIGDNNYATKFRGSSYDFATGNATFASDVTISDVQPRFRFDETDTTNENFEFRHNGGDLILDKIDDDFSSNRVERMRIDSSGNVTLTGTLTTGGVITCNNVSGDKKIAFRRTGANNFSIEHDSSQIYFYNETTTESPLLIQNDGDVTMNAGNVGIGKSIPVQKLDVEGSIRLNSELQIFTGTTDIGQISNSGGALNIQGTSTRDVSLGSDSYPQAVFIEGSNGRVVIGGQTASANTLTLSGTATEMDMTNTSTNGRQYRLESDSAGLFVIKDRTANVDRIVLNSSGNLKLSTHGAFIQMVRDTGSAVIDVMGFNNGTNTLEIKGGSSTGTAIKFKDTSGDVMAIHNHRVGIGTNLPNAQLHLFNSAAGGQPMLQVMSHLTAAGSFTNNYMVEFCHAFSGVNHGMLVKNRETDNARRTLDIADGNGVFATFTNGKLGIGLTSPASRLHVKEATNRSLSSSVAQMRIEGDGYTSFFALDGSSFQIGQNSNFRDLTFHSGASGLNILERLRIKNNGVMQLTTTSSHSFLNANGTALELDVNRDPESGAFSNTSKSHARIQIAGDNGGSNIKFNTASANNTTATERVRIDKNGFIFNPSMGAGSGEPSVLWWSGSTSAYGISGMLIRDSSSRTFKKNERVSEIDTSKIFDLELKQFEWNEKSVTKDRTDFGLIAEDVDEILPELVVKKDNEYFTVRYNMIGILAVQELKKANNEIELLKAEIEQLKIQINGTN